MSSSDNTLELAKTQDFCVSAHPRLAAVMIHGIASTSSTYDKAIDHFKNLRRLDDVRFITFDLLGSGESRDDDDLNYDYDEYLSALKNSINKLDLDIPLVLVGHSLGTFIATRYAKKYGNDVSNLILISPPVYTEDDLENPAFATGMKLFEEAISARNPGVTKKKSFRNAIDNIVINKTNYDTLATLKTPPVLIYGERDQLISAYNIPLLLEKNSKLTAIKTSGGHGVTEDKYIEVARLLEEILNAKNL